MLLVERGVRNWNSADFIVWESNGGKDDVTQQGIPQIRNGKGYRKNYAMLRNNNQGRIHAKNFITSLIILGLNDKGKSCVNESEREHVC